MRLHILQNDKTKNVCADFKIIINISLQFQKEKKNDKLQIEQPETGTIATQLVFWGYANAKPSRAAQNQHWSHEICSLLLKY